MICEFELFSLEQSSVTTHYVIDMLKKLSNFLHSLRKLLIDNKLLLESWKIHTVGNTDIMCDLQCKGPSTFLVKMMEMQ